MNFYFHRFLPQLANFFLQLGRLVVRFLQSQVWIKFQVQFDEQSPIALLCEQIMDCQSTARIESKNGSPFGARGSACTTTSDGTISPTRSSIASLHACTCSRLAVRGTLTVASTK